MEPTAEARDCRQLALGRGGVLSRDRANCKQKDEGSPEANIALTGFLPHRVIIILRTAGE